MNQAVFWRERWQKWSSLFLPILQATILRKNAKLQLCLCFLRAQNMKLYPPPRLEITCKWNKNCTEKIMVPLKFLRKRSSRFGATCWGITTHQANRADGLCKYCKGLPHPSACASLWVVIPQHVAPNLELLFPNYFSGTYGISVQFFLIGPFFLTGCTAWFECPTPI